MMRTFADTISPFDIVSECDKWMDRQKKQNFHSIDKLKEQKTNGWTDRRNRISTA